MVWWRRSSPFKAGESQKSYRTFRKKSAAPKALEAEENAAGVPEEGSWNRWLVKILMAVLKADTEAAAQRKMEAIAQAAIESPVRGSNSLIEFATELDKAAKFGIWQAKVLWKGDLLAQALTSFES